MDASKMKWNSKGPEAEALIKLFKDNAVDTTQQKPAYIKKVQADYPQFFGRFPTDRFVINYRKLLNSYLVGLAKTGARQRKSFDETSYYQNQCTNFYSATQMATLFLLHL